MPILEKVCISLYLGIFRLTAAATAATSQELSISGKAPGPSRAGIKYPVRESLTLIIVSWPECQPEFPDDADGGDNAPTNLQSGHTPIP